MTIGSLLLAAGRGIRMDPLTARVPKPALPLLDVPLAAFGLARLAAVCPPVAVNVSHLGDTLVEALRPYGAFESLVEQPKALGTAGTLGAILHRVGKRLVVLNGDALLDADLAGFIQPHRDSGAQGTIAVRPVSAGADVVLEDGRAASMVDRRTRPDAAGFQFTGLSLFERSALIGLTLEEGTGLTERVLAPLTAAGRLQVYVHDGYFADVGTFPRYLQASLDLLYGRGPAPPVPWPGTIVDVDGGRAYVAGSARAPSDALGPGAIVLDGATVDEGARIERSIVLPGSHLGARTLVDAVYPVAERIGELARGKGSSA